MLMRALTTVAMMALFASNPAEACSVRGQFCGYPSWAANAFEDPLDRPIGYNAATMEKPAKPASERKIEKKAKRSQGAADRKS